MKKVALLTFISILFCFLPLAYADLNNQNVKWVWFDKDTNSYQVFLKDGSPESSPVHFPQKEVHLKLDTAVPNPVLKIGGHDGKKVTLIFPNVESLKCALTEYRSSEHPNFDQIERSNPCFKKVLFLAQNLNHQYLVDKYFDRSSF